MPGLFMATSPTIPLPIRQVSVIVCQLSSIFSVGEHHIDNQVVTYFPQDYITVTLPSLKFGPPVPLLQSSGVMYTILNFDISSPRILCEINVWILYYTMTHARTMKQIFLFWLSKVSTTLRFCLISEFQGALAWMTRHHITRFDTCELVRDPCLSFSSILSFLPQKTQA